MDLDLSFIVVAIVGDRCLLAHFTGLVPVCYSSIAVYTPRYLSVCLTASST